MKRNILAMVLALSTITAPAMAATFDLGDLSGVDYTKSESFRNVTGGTVSSTYTFTLSQSSIVHLSLTDSSRLTGLSASVWDTTAGNVYKGGVGPLNSNGAFGDWESSAALAAGTYKVDVVGAYASRGSYALTLSSEVAAPVPGPAGIIVAGAGALVVAARKRRKARTAAIA